MSQDANRGEESSLPWRRKLDMSPRPSDAGGIPNCLLIHARFVSTGRRIYGIIIHVEMSEGLTKMKKLLIIGTAAVILAGTIIAADVPWQFTGDDTRTSASTGVSASSVPSFLTGTQTPCVVTATLATGFNSDRGFVLIFK